MDETTKSEGRHVQCPFSKLDEESQIIRRRDLKSLADQFADSLSPLDRLITLMQEQNVELKRVSIVLRRVMVAMLVMAVAMVIALYMHVMNTRKAVLLSDSMGEAAEQMTLLEGEIGTIISELAQVKDTASSTEKKVEQAQEQTESKPQLEIVAETDPVKARRAPMKLRLLPPVKADVPMAPLEVLSSSAEAPPPPAPSTPVAEIPLHLEAF
jgi:hypothetical protein